MPRTILVADDEDDVRELVRLTLEEDGYEVLDAGDGDRAWRLLLEARPFMAILDVTMPGRNGLELAQAITAEASLQHTKVVLLTGVSPIDLDGPGRRSPAEPQPRIDLYVMKPFTPRSLREALASELR